MQKYWGVFWLSLILFHCKTTKPLYPSQVLLFILFDEHCFQNLFQASLCRDVRLYILIKKESKFLIEHISKYFPLFLVDTTSNLYPQQIPCTAVVWLLIVVLLCLPFCSQNMTETGKEKRMGSERYEYFITCAMTSVRHSSWCPMGCHNPLSPSSTLTYNLLLTYMLQDRK